jgi:hypothetical protein
MSTPFSAISKLMQLEMQQSDLYKLGKINTDIALDIISDFILNGANVDFATCRKDLENNIPYTEEEITFKITESETTVEIDITSIPENMRNNLILYINDVEILDFNYEIKDSSTNSNIKICDIVYPFNKNDVVSLLFVFEGEFEEDLSHREKYIVALSAYYHYLTGKIQEENRLIKQLGDKDYKIIRGNMSNDLLSLKTSVWNNLRTYIIAYNNQTSTVEDFM